ncbi:MULTISPECIES: kdo(2)-lipid IV(A) palmitoleoyltransferase [Enterobacteriaceae]|jgi:KDO2-lipid IV(A) palmitoleoyltransferase|uniref:kdo(2)-lipid IV(A) palmitoleoyltransferase n=1 Tax=Enterobacteriaceae TaxID=543 RepID=UPI00136F4784|nr:MULTISPECIES: kdo(2)-lipid IV(A) palmitoleoyltransferase [Enterobacteriaceae]MBE3513068.1 kdo(2)-lipid IV(A) palmitoleoyltransferase [Enterobacter cloacae complex sp. I2]MXS38475.1 kdo(2)-lipid IV(A) palmitoleoyltransferase [Enterobacter hormaechei]UMB87513.1 kdo(2)-lipid IV(A) palmitoleoyltransferase [Citrobacter portucalensis]HBI6865970.1 kdo(2)-lipid IV(A) palmitoleoyltransferase [Enterobacter cancerogenus]
MAQTFTHNLLHPRHWLTWSGLGLLWLLVQLPYPILHILGSGLGKISRPFLKRREGIAIRNIELCFPEMTPFARSQMVNKNFVSLGLGLMETGIAWFWSDARVKKWFDVEGLENLTGATRGVMVVGIHFMSLELCGRVMGLCHPMMATYRPHNDPLMEWVQTKGRMRSNKAMINRRNLSGFVHALKAGEAVWFAPDQDYGSKGSVFAPFFSVKKAATTNGTYALSKLAGAPLITLSMIRRSDKKGYHMYISNPLSGYPGEDKVAAAAYMNKIIEREILRAPEQYLWMHRRFKTRPEGEVSLYK